MTFDHILVCVFRVAFKMDTILWTKIAKYLYFQVSFVCFILVLNWYPCWIYMNITSEHLGGLLSRLHIVCKSHKWNSTKELFHCPPNRKCIKIFYWEKAKKHKYIGQVQKLLTNSLVIFSYRCVSTREMIKYVHVWFIHWLILFVAEQFL